jgi:hypothetical protein
MSSFEIVRSSNLFPGETAWEVMEQSQLYGEKPVRLVVSSESIRTVTSLALTKPKEYKEFWRVLSGQIIKVSWCPDLCVLYIIYISNLDATQQITKVFFAEHLVGKRIIQHYKKIKPASVQLSPGRKSKNTKKVTNINDVAVGNEPLTSLLSTSFRLKTSLNQEKFWRALIVSDYSACREIFFGISPIGMRIVTPETLDAELVVSLICVSDLKFFTYLGSPTLAFKYIQDLSNTTKIKKIRFHVLPVTAQEMLRWYDYCINFGDLSAGNNFLKYDETEELQMEPDIPLKMDKNDKNNLIRIKSAENVPLSDATNNNQSLPQPQPFKPPNKRKDHATKSVTKIPNENQPPYYYVTQKTKGRPSLTKSRSFLHSGTRV